MSDMEESMSRAAAFGVVFGIILGIQATVIWSKVQILKRISGVTYLHL